LIILAFASLAALALGSWFLSRQCIFCGTNLDVSTIEANTEVDIPDSATDIDSFAEGFQDITTLVRFRIPAGALPAFLASTGCQDAPTPIDPGSISSPGTGPAWWQPQDADSIEVCTGIENRTHQTIYIDTSNPEMLFIYLVAAVY
jgi:hypothetical protein